VRSIARGTFVTVPWKKKRDPLYRGDDATALSLPDPTARTSVVEHVLYLGGAGRRSPYQSTSESEGTAQRFAGRNGRVYQTTAPRAEGLGIVHIGQVELKKLLRGKGHGRAAGSSPLLVMQARQYVERWAEHLLDFSAVVDEDVPRIVGGLYER
jgi:hypothetical protein